jgi:integrase
MECYRLLLRDNLFCVWGEELARGHELDGGVRTASAYRTAMSRFRVFNGGEDLHLDEMTPSVVMGFEQSLKGAGCGMNTVSFYMRTLRAIYNKAVAAGRIARPADDPFAGVYTGVSATRKLALSSRDLASLASLDPTSSANRSSARRLPDHLAEALAMFLFCYHARGMCYVDMANLKKSDLRGGTITYRRHKTGRRLELRVLPAMRRIIDWFRPRTGGSQYLFPVITNPYKSARLQYESGLRLQNKRLKQIAVLCGLDHRLSTHVARHSWATVAKSAGLPLAVISEGLGHTNQRTTEIYLSSLERSVIDLAARVVSEAIVSSGPSRRRRPPRLFGGTGGLPWGGVLQP